MSVASSRSGSAAAQPAGNGDDALLEVEHLRVLFPIKSGVIIDRQIGHVHAVDDVSFSLRKGETLGIVGESGCGKTTLIRVLVRLLDPTSGSIRFRGTDITSSGRRQLQPIRKEMQMVFQDPQASLNPRKRVGQILATPLSLRGVAKDKIESESRQLLEKVGLQREALNRFPHEFSGGQRQRIGIARALALNPKILICDEPVSALDVSIQGQVINLLERLQNELGLAYLFIAHDLSVVRHIADQVAVMYLGRMVESGADSDVYDHAAHPYTQALMSAVPVPDPTLRGQRAEIILEGDVPSPMNPPAGCNFHTRCWLANQLAAGDLVAGGAVDEQRDAVPPVCRQEVPVLTTYGTGQHLTACHFSRELVR